ncbi:MAG: carbon monoxide dehydrogenase subunit G [Pseudomonadota bacterium]
MPEGKGYAMRGVGSTVVSITPDALWDLVMDEARLAAAIPGAETLRREDVDGARTYVADVKIGVGFIKGTYVVSARFSEMVAPSELILHGGAQGPLGNSSGEGWVDVLPHKEGTQVRYAYAILISGAVAAAGGRLLDGAADHLIAKFFKRLAKSAETMPADTR